MANISTDLMLGSILLAIANERGLSPQAWLANLTKIINEKHQDLYDLLARPKKSLPGNHRTEMASVHKALIALREIRSVARQDPDGLHALKVNLCVVKNLEFSKDLRTRVGLVRGGELSSVVAHAASVPPLQLWPAPLRLVALSILEIGPL